MSQLQDNINPGNLKPKDLVVKELKKGVVKSLQEYSESEATTNAGAVVRFIARWLPTDFLLDLLVEKTKKQFIK